MPPVPTLVAIVLTMTVAGAMQASTGMGFALLSVPILVMINPHLVPGPLLVAALVLTAMASYRDRADLDHALLRRGCVGLLIGTTCGALALKRLAGIDLAPLFGALVVLAVGLSVFVRRVSATPAIVLAGATTAGIMGTMVGVGGPAIALVLQNERAAGARAMLNTFAFLGNVVGIISLSIVGLFGRRELLLGLLLMPGMALGYLIAPFIAKHVGKQTLRPIILIVSALGGIGLLFH